MKETSQLQPYLPPTERVERTKELADQLDAALICYGTSVEGRELHAVRVPCLQPSPEPKRVMLCANIHGIEWITSYVALRFLEAMHEPSEALHTLRQKAEIWVLPSLNPDGYANTWALQGKGTLKQMRTNANGVDLNRNFPKPGKLPWYALALGGWATGSKDPKNAFFCGTHPFSEPETHALDQLLQQHTFHASANMHSTMGTFFPAHVQGRADFETYRTLCKAFSNAQLHVPYRRLASRTFDWFTGEQEDHLHHAYGLWSICVEVFSLQASLRQHLFPPKLFWRFNPYEPERWAKNDIPGIIAYFLAALAQNSPPGCHGNVNDPHLRLL